MRECPGVKMEKQQTRITHFSRPNRTALTGVFAGAAATVGVVDDVRGRMGSRAG